MLILLLINFLKAYPCAPIDNDTFWPQNAIDIFKAEVAEKIVQLYFDHNADEAEWFVFILRLSKRIVIFIFAVGYYILLELLLMIGYEANYVLVNF